MEYYLVSARRHLDMYDGSCRLEMQFATEEAVVNKDGRLELPHAGDIHISRCVDKNHLVMMEALMQPGTVYRMNPKNAPTKSMPHIVVQGAKAALLDDGECLRVVREQEKPKPKPKTPPREKYSNFQSVEGMREWLRKGMPRYKGEAPKPEPIAVMQPGPVEPIDWHASETTPVFPEDIPTSSQIEHPIRNIGAPRLPPELRLTIKNNVMNCDDLAITDSNLIRMRQIVRETVLGYFHQHGSFDPIEFEKCFGFPDVNRLDVVVERDGVSGIDITWGEIVA